jgi:hypothetical protein
MDIHAIFRAFGGPTALGEAIGVGRTHAGTMKTRGSIPPEYWPALIKAAAKREIEGITAEALMQIAADNAAKRKPASLELQATGT